MTGFSEYKNDDTKEALIDDLKEIAAGIILALIIFGMIVFGMAM